MKRGRLNKRIFNDLKVTDHHGLLITEKVPSALSAKEATVYKLIALRLLEAISQPCIREVTTVTLLANHYEFVTGSNTVTEPGWRGIQNEFAAVVEDINNLPELHKGEAIKITEVSLEEKHSRAPQLYTEATLLDAMETAGNTLEDKALKDAIKGSGLGTPATRAAIIETLLQRGYIERKQKALIPTAKGIEVFDLVADKDIASVAMTAEWEAAFEEIGAGTYSSRTFQEAIVAYTKKITQELLSTKVTGEKLPELLCPKCKEHSLLINERLIRCPDQLCGWQQYRNLCGIQLSVGEIEQLIKNGQTGSIKGMTSKSGKKFNARLILKDTFEVEFMFDK